MSRRLTLSVGGRSRRDGGLPCVALQGDEGARVGSSAATLPVGDASPFDVIVGRIGRRAHFSCLTPKI